MDLFIYGTLLKVLYLYISKLGTGLHFHSQYKGKYIPNKAMLFQQSKD